MLELLSNHMVSLASLPLMLNISYMLASQEWHHVRLVYLDCTANGGRNDVDHRDGCHPHSHPHSHPRCCG